LKIATQQALLHDQGFALDAMHGPQCISSA
jgi:hypothetical protein